MTAPRALVEIEREAFRAGVLSTVSALAWPDGKTLHDLTIAWADDAFYQYLVRRESVTKGREGAPE